MISPNICFEKSLIPPNCRFLMGIDEVGRGPWAGPVTVGAFLLDLSVFDPQVFINLKVRDSKTLSLTQRLYIFSQFQKLNFTYQTFSADSQTIDQLGIGVAIENLISQALSHFSSRFDFCLLDGNFKTDKLLAYSSPSSRGGVGGVFSLIDADATCFSVAAASICAKVTRDLEMDKYDSIYPQYDFKNNKGYGTAKHQQALKDHGPCPIHRQSYKPIKQFL